MAMMIGVQYIFNNPKKNLESSEVVFCIDLVIGIVVVFVVTFVNHRILRNPKIGNYIFTLYFYFLCILYKFLQCGIVAWGGDIKLDRLA